MKMENIAPKVGSEPTPLANMLTIAQHRLHDPQTNELTKCILIREGKHNRGEVLGCDFIQ